MKLQSCSTYSCSRYYQYWIWLKTLDHNYDLSDIPKRLVIHVACEYPPYHFARRRGGETCRLRLCYHRTLPTVLVVRNAIRIRIYCLFYAMSLGYDFNA